MVVMVRMHLVIANVIFKVIYSPGPHATEGRMNTTPLRSGNVQSERVQKTLFLGSYRGKSCASGTQKADAEILLINEEP